jgi:subtilisin family serine protease
MLQSGLGNIIADHNVSSAWQKGYTGNNILVAVVDNGVNHQHQEFRGRYVSKILTLMWNTMTCKL